MKRRVATIALAQISYFENSNDNLDKIKKYIKLAKKKGADIVCFPESCIHKNDVLHFNHSLINEIKKECEKNSIWCIVDEDLKIRGKVYNTAVLINREGNIQGYYKKINLMGDTEGLNAGKKPKVFETDFGKIGIAICWDLSFPKLFQKIKRRGAEIVFCPSHWAYETKAHEDDHKNREKKIIRSLVGARAFENLCFVAFCSPKTRHKDLVTYSVISSPHRILKEISEKEGLLVARLNLNEISKFTKLYKEAV